MNYVLLLGAGFSRNWGGWLATEAFEYLLGCPQIDAGLNELLWKHRRRGDFEAALAELQEAHFRSNRQSPEPALANLQDAILQMFNDMDEAFGRVQFEFQNHLDFMVGSFLVRFDAIFTLNQDLLLERHYLHKNVDLQTDRNWDGGHIPGMKPSATGPSGSVSRILARPRRLARASVSPLSGRKQTSNVKGKSTRSSTSAYEQEADPAARRALCRLLARRRHWRTIRCPLQAHVRLRKGARHPK